MKIINVQNHPQYFSYASTTAGGKTLTAGQESPDLPLNRIHIDVFQKDLKEGKIQIRMSENDKAYMGLLMAEDKKPINVKKLPVASPRPRKTVKKASKPPMKAKPSQFSVQPKFTQPIVPITNDNLKKGAVSLSDLNNANRAATKGSGVPEIPIIKTTLADIQAFTKSKV